MAISTVIMSEYDRIGGLFRKGTYRKGIAPTGEVTQW